MLKEQNIEITELNEEAIGRVTGGEEQNYGTIELILTNEVKEKGETLAGMIGGN